MRSSILANLFFLIFLSLTGCTQYQARIPDIEPVNQIAATSTPISVITPRATSEPIDDFEDDRFTIPTVFIESGIFLPEDLVRGMQIVQKESDADVIIQQTKKEMPVTSVVFERFYFITVPFSELVFEMPFNELVSLWQGKSSMDVVIWIPEDELVYLRTILGEPELKHVRVSKTKPESCKEITCYQIKPIEDLNSKERILAIDGLRPLQLGEFMADYPLVYRLSAIPGEESIQLSSKIHTEKTTNFSPEKFTSLVMSGTTALVRWVALRMEENGYEYPAKVIGKYLEAADLTHISNEAPFFEMCPPAVPLRKEMRFCSAPEYLSLFDAAGVDIIELTGNHLLDWGPDAMLETLTIFKDQNFLVYGGGKNAEQAAAPLLIEHNGNHLAFLGCNVPGPENNFATDTKPGAARCNMEELVDEIRVLTNEGYEVIVTFQHYEFDSFRPNTLIQKDFFTAAENGAVIVSGSQAHFPQGFDIVNGSFIHFGVGNLFFDQMETWYRKATIDVHYFYDGEYLISDFIPIMLEDHSQPRLMNEEERKSFTERMMEYSFYYEKK